MQGAGSLWHNGAHTKMRGVQRGTSKHLLRKSGRHPRGPQSFPTAAHQPQQRAATILLSQQLQLVLHVRAVVVHDAPRLQNVPQFLPVIVLWHCAGRVAGQRDGGRMGSNSRSL